MRFGTRHTKSVLVRVQGHIQRTQAQVLKNAGRRDANGILELLRSGTKVAAARNLETLCERLAGAIVGITVVMMRAADRRSCSMHHRVVMVDDSGHELVDRLVGVTVVVVAM
jgi:hypothetical protein